MLRELGIAIPLGARVVPLLRQLLEDADSALPRAVRPALAEAGQEILDPEQRLRTVELQL